MLQIVAQQLYLAYFGRPADPAGLSNFSARLAQFLPANSNIDDLAQVYNIDSRAVSLVGGFSISQESRDLYTGGSQQFIDSIYRNILNRPGEPEGLAFWVDALDNRALDPAKAALEIIAAALRNQARDADTVLRKTEVASNFTQALDTLREMEAFSGNAAAASARSMLGLVDAETDVTTFQTEVNAVIEDLIANADFDGSTPADATIVTFGSTTQALFNNEASAVADVDVFKLSVQQNSLFEVLISTAVSGSYRLLSGTGELIGSGIMAAGASSAQILRFANSVTGDLFLEFSSIASGNTMYSFEIRDSVDDFADVQFGAATLGSGSGLAGTLSNINDRDVFRFFGEAGKRYFVEVNSLPPTAGLETQLNISQPASNVSLVLNNLGGFADESGTRLATVLDQFGTGDVFLSLINTSGTANGSFNIQYTEVVQVDNTGDTFATAKPLALNTETIERIDANFDVDVFKVNLQAGTGYNLSLNVLSQTSGFTVAANLYTKSGVLVEPDLILSGQSVNQEFFVRLGGEYLIEINDLNFDKVGDYSLTLTTQVPAPSAVDTFDIEFVYQDGTSAYSSFFEQVGARLSRVLSEGLPNFNLSNGQVIDDLRVNVQQRAIDGLDGVLAFAGPDGFRSKSEGFLPYLGTVVIDSADAQSMINDDAFFDVMLHEVMHVLGSGTLWDFFGLSKGGQYTGASALQVYQILTGDGAKTFVPTELQSGHWDEDVFDNELMTPSVNFFETVSFSALSLAALEDLGYSVDYSQADNFVLPTGIQFAESSSINGAYV